MQNVNTINFIGASGNSYTFYIYPKETDFLDVGGVYIFTYCYRDQQGTIRYRPLYIGKTQSLADRPQPGHEKWECANENGFNSICAYQDNDATSRRQAEIDLLNNYITPCNEQYQP